MERYVAFLRGMNLGKRRIKNDELRPRFEALGFEDVPTFRASGNVVFGAGGRVTRRALTARIEAGLRRSLGYEVPVFLRSGAELLAIAARSPSGQLLEASKGKLQVVFLLGAPAEKQRKEVLALASDEDRSRSMAASSTGCQAAGCPNPSSTSRRSALLGP